MVIAMFCCELSRYFLARDELKANTEAAALCCETALVSSGNPLDTTNQTNAVNTAISLFQQNSILGQPMTNSGQTTNITSPSDLAPGPGQAQICFQFLDPITRKPITTSTGTTPSGALIDATTSYCYTPLLGQFLGMGQAQFTFQVSALSGVPRIDVVIAFDVSGYQDVFTPGAPVQRGAPPNSTTTGGGNPTTTGGGNPTTTGGGTCTWAYGSDNQTQGLRYMAINPGNGVLFGTTMAAMTNHPGLGAAEAPHFTPPHMYENMDNYSGIPNPIYWSESTLSPSTNNLFGYNGNANTPSVTGPPGNLCCIPTNGTTTGSGGPPAKGPESPITYLNIPAKKSQLIASTKACTGEDLQDLCAAVNASAGNKQLKTHSHCRQRSDILKTISFLPAADAANIYNPTSTNTGSQNTTTNTGGGTSDFADYTWTVDGQSYFGATHTNSVPLGQPNYNQTATPIPGKCSPITSATTGGSSVAAGAGVKNVFTNLIVNLDGQNTFGCNWTDANGYYFYDQGACVEAEDGNLESSTASNNAYVDTSDMGTTAQSGYAAAYYNDVFVQLQPLQDLLNAVNQLVNEMKGVADVHFSFIAFNGSAGNAATALNPAQYSSATSPPAAPNGYPSSDTYVPMISSLFPYPAPTLTSGQAATYILPSLPFIPLDPNPQSTTDPDSAHTDLINLLPLMQPNGPRNVAAGLTAALNQFTNNARPGANKVIVLFCSGVPTEANISNSQALQDALTQAQSAATSNIPIFCVTVADPLTANGGDDTADNTAYNDNSNGLCYTAAPGPGIGHRYCRVDWAGNSATLGSLSTVIDYIVRQMVQMI